MLAAVGGITAVLLLFAPMGASGARAPLPPSAVPIPGPTAAATTSSVTPALGFANLSLGTAAAPATVCAVNSTLCSAATPTTRVELSAQATAPTMEWPAVQVAFVVETTAYDGVYDPSQTSIEKWSPAGWDPCGSQSTNAPLCEESNAVPFFEDHVSSITSVIQASNPHSQVSYAMIDYGSTCDFWDDFCDQQQVHVDTSQFLDSQNFVNVVSSNFKGGVLSGGYVLPDEDLADNFLHSASITALYGAMAGNLLGWTNNTHHVIVWMGSTAPRDPSYPVNYCVSPTAMGWDNSYGPCNPTTCEPGYLFPGAGAMPSCEGWIHSQDGNPAHSIATLAHQAPSCVQSVGGLCTIDTIDVWNTPTDPFSQGWPTTLPWENQNLRLGPGAPHVLADSENILLAGCDLAAATGGTWDGPSFFSCPDGQAGGLAYVPHGPVNNPNTANPTLLAGFREAGFGPVSDTLIAVGGSSPMFTYLPPPNFALASSPEFAVVCETPTGYYGGCPVSPTVTHYLGTPVLGWNWSTNRSQNEMYYGDSWRVSFDLVNTGPPFGEVPVLRCDTKICLSKGSSPVQGAYSWADYLLPNSTSRVTESFPYAGVDVLLGSSAIGIIQPPPPPTVPPEIPVVIPTTTTNPVAVGLPIPTVIGTFSLQAMAAGLLMAGLTRVMMKNKPIAMQVAVKSGPAQSKFEAGQKTGPQTGHFE